MRRALPDLFASLPAQPDRSAQQTPCFLWLALWFPCLSLEALQVPPEIPYVVVTIEHKTSMIYAASRVAQTYGISSGMPLSAAQVCCPHLQYGYRNLLAEHKLLQQHAETALDFSSWVSLINTDSLILEVHGSLRLFQGLAALIKQLIAQLHCEVTWALSPSPSASVLLAQAAPYHEVYTPAALRSVLGPLAIAHLPFNENILKRITVLGVHHLRDLWRLPTDGLSRRLGTNLVQYLKQLIGQTCEVPTHFFKAPSFFAKQSLWQEVYQHQHFLPLIKQLIQQLCEFLHRHDAATDAIQIHLYHSAKLFTPIHLNLAQSSREADYFMRLIQLKLESLPISHSINAASVKCLQISPFLAKPDDFFQARHNLCQEWMLLEDYLKARLGDACLQQLYAPAEQRPEKAISFRASESIAGPHLRPLWLLSKPISYHKPNQLTDYPERIEAGWWDGYPIRRDYYRMVTETGQRLWIFHDLIQQRWYIHGLFG
jgi:protein ImuB